RKGQTFWVPFARSTPIFYYNKDMWAKAGLPDRGPKTWDELTQEWAPKLKGLGENIFAHPGAASYIAWIFQGVIWQWGGEYSDPEFNIKLQDPRGVAAGEFYRASIRDGWAAAVKDLDADFRTGSALSIIGSTAGLAGHEGAAKFAVGTSFLPEGPAGFGCCTGGAGMSILSSTPVERQQAAMKFINYATGPATATWSQSTGYMPVRKSAINGPAMAEWYKQHANFKTVVDQLPRTRPQDAARVFIPNGDQIIGKGLERITITQESPEVVWKDVAATLEREAQPVLRSIQALGA
ncbi:MAG: extracellular solute-binding protein, partial [Chloroflexota bacterium]